MTLSAEERGLVRQAVAELLDLYEGKLDATHAARLLSRLRSSSSDAPPPPDRMQMVLVEQQLASYGLKLL